MSNETTDTIEITVADRNGASITYIANKGKTFNDLLKDQVVRDSFGFGPDDDLYSYLNEIDGAEIPTVTSLRDLTFRGAMQEGDICVFDLDFVDKEKEEAEADSNDAHSADPVAECPYVQEAQNRNTGKVMVEINGGLKTALVDIEPGITTIEQIVHTDIVRAKSGESDERLSAYVVIYKGQARQCDELKYLHPEHGDLIQITPPTLSTKGI